MNNIKLLYPTMELDSINELDIIFLLRNIFAHNNKLSSSERKVLEQEVLELVKSKEYDWNVKDIDHNTILTYAVHNNVSSVLDYLIPNKYDLSTYDSSISSALDTAVFPPNTAVLDYLLEKHEMHLSYKENMLTICYMYASSTSNNIREKYLEHASKLISEDISFVNVMQYVLRYTEDLIYHFLANYPDSNKNKLEKSKEIANMSYTPAEQKRYDIKNKLLILEKYELYCDLKENLENKLSVKVKNKV